MYQEQLKYDILNYLAGASPDVGEQKRLTANMQKISSEFGESLKRKYPSSSALIDRAVSDVNKEIAVRCYNPLSLAFKKNITDEDVGRVKQRLSEQFPSLPSGEITSVKSQLYYIYEIRSCLWSGIHSVREKTKIEAAVPVPDSLKEIREENRKNFDVIWEWRKEQVKKEYEQRVLQAKMDNVISRGQQSDKQILDPLLETPNVTQSKWDANLYEASDEVWAKDNSTDSKSAVMPSPVALQNDTHE